MVYCVDLIPCDLSRGSSGESGIVTYQENLLSLLVFLFIVFVSPAPPLPHQSIHSAELKLLLHVQ